ncbi:MAG TPA: adenosylcobinamide-phosphate synthase CbiB [Methylomirabilota bacterium]|nr:adenosylcobinamide-phosphate synthase CbiB [Methylomirabilota bacterium]
MTLLVLAVALDLLLGDPPNRWHPVAGIGRLIGLGRARAPAAPADLMLYGTLLILIVAGVAAGLALIAHAVLGELPGAAAPLAQAWLLKCSFSLRGLTDAVEVVRGHLVVDDLDGARRQVAWHLVSRPTADLDRGAVGSAAVESLAENLTDGFVAPVAFFVAGTLLGGSAAGLASAWAYRAVNTADAMIGYRDAELDYLGRATARIDDALNYVPARLAAGALVAGAWLARESWAGAAAMRRRDATRTASPNAGQTMAAMAGALGVTLAKAGHYRLGDGPPPDVEAIDRALRVEAWAATLSLVGAALILVVRP